MIEEVLNEIRQAEEKADAMIKDANARLLIADKELIPLVGDYKGPVLTTAELENLPDAPCTAKGPKPENLYILLYTSGSTGTPKGCMLEQRNLVNFCLYGNTACVDFCSECMNIISGLNLYIASVYAEHAVRRSRP